MLQEKNKASRLALTNSTYIHGHEKILVAVLFCQSIKEFSLVLFFNQTNMFGLFKKKDSLPVLIHNVYLNQTSRFRMMMKEADQWIENGHHILLLYHFDETGKVLNELVKSSKLDQHKITIDKSDQLQNGVHEKIPGPVAILVAEIHPMAGKDQLLHECILKSYPYSKILFFTSTDGPLMKAFGGEKIHKMMLALGMDENEKLEHSMITKSIFKAQEKIKAKVQHEKPAYSKQEWMDTNVKHDLQG